MALTITDVFVFAAYQQAMIKLEQESPNLAEVVRETLGGSFGSGETGVASRIKFLSGRIDKECRYHRQKAECCGIWEYDIAEPLGEWLVTSTARKGKGPTDDMIVNKAKRLTKTWRYKNA